jgi:hypothetical protein
MAAVVLTLTVDNVAQVLAAYDHIRLYRSQTGPTGDFVAITDASTDIPLVPGQSQYQYEDLNGDPTFWYKSAFVNQITNSSSPTSNAFGTGLDAALSVLSVQELKDNFLFGIDLTDAQGNPLPEAFFVRAIKASVASVETLLDLTLAPTPVLSERKDYVQREIDQYYFVNLNKRPVQSVQSFRLHVPGASPVIFPKPWIEVQEAQGVVEIVPQTAIAMTPTLSFTTYYSQLFLTATRRRLPNALEIDYMAGFAPGQVPGDILELVGKQAAIHPLRTAGNLLLGAGVAGQSIGIDGLSQSVSLTKQGNGAFAAMVQDFQQDILQLRTVLRGRYQGVPMRMV